MTVEEALLAVVGVIAVVLLFLGLVDALEGDPRARFRGRRRRPVRREPAPPPPPPAAWRARAHRPAPPPARPIPDPGAEVPPRDAAREAAAVEWRDRVAALIRSRELGETRRLLDAALARDDVGLETAGFLLEVGSTAVARDLWRLRRALRRGGGDAAPLDGSLAITRLLLDAPVAQELPREQRRRVSCRLWRGHTRLGLRRWRSGNFDAAVEALFEALGMREIDERRRRLTRDLLVRTLEDMAGQRLELIPQLLGESDRAAALEQAQGLLAHIHRTREEGVSAEDLAVAASRARQLLDHIEQAPVR
ncbi:MAG TPA: hypothetical protein VK878_11855 [Candidatus Deferrimicrobiaceae bacterium]|nr:hypothetical protein [Candidatus Deferrimicrobiaceae bacterium]